jgi:hypothetical protein
MHKTDEDFERQKRRDRAKAALFHELRIPTLYVREFAHPFEAEDVRAKINLAMDEAGIDPAMRVGPVDLKEHLPLLQGRYLEQLRELARRQNITLLDTCWRGAWETYRWQCNLCPEIFTAPFATRRLAKGQGCPTCSRTNAQLLAKTSASRVERNKSSYLLNLRERAEGLGLVLLDRQWKGAGVGVLYQFRCAYQPGSIVDISYNNLLKRHLGCKCDEHRRIAAAFRERSRVANQISMTNLDPLLPGDDGAALSP